MMLSGKSLPHNKDAENHVIGACLYSQEALIYALDVLRPEMFYLDVNRKIFWCVDRIIREGGAVDMITVTQMATKHGLLEEIGGAYALTLYPISVLNRVTYDHIEIIRVCWQRRSLIQDGAKIIEDAYDFSEDYDQIISKLMGLVGELVTGSNQIKSIADSEREIVESITAGTAQKDVAIKTDFPEIDHFMDFVGTNFYVIAARPGMGKTALALSIASRTSNPTLFFSLEMGYVQLFRRVVSIFNKVPSESLKIGLNENEAKGYVMQVRGIPLYVDDTPGLTIQNMRLRAKQYAMRFGIKRIVVDYLQLCRDPEARNREQEISQISQGLKGLAKELNVPVIALAQLNRAVESRSNKEPQLSDLRESGAIEQDADMVAFLYRPGYYWEEMEGEPVDPTEAQLIVAKHRDGRLGRINLKWDENTTRFYSSSDSDRDYSFNDDIEF